ncbi:fumarylacetoacetate hydrolase family protein [Natrarchaeobius sp. A-rgal3]|uniref:fumarylacetoacetate hydrolase family protein n=1 Tax=Natrarchaeobius versutus TaxID=1679078 RepID=UPI00350F6219
MRFVRYTRGGGPQWGVQTDEEIHSLSSSPSGNPSYEDLANPQYRASVESAVERGAYATVDADEVDFLAPVGNPGKIVCVGLNYYDHAEEQDEEPPEKPMLFGKASTSVTDPGAPIVHPEDVEQVDYEVELGVVIGRTAVDVDAEDARDYVAGYTAINDVSGRDAQFEDGQFYRGKSYDTFGPMGPALVTDEEIDPNAVDVECRVNGDVKQRSNTEEFIFDVDDLVEYISSAMTLRPGDVISTGTPGGVGIFREPPELLESGDSVDVEVEGIGTLTNPVVE